MENLPKAASVIAEGMERGLHVGAQVYVSMEGTVVADTAMGSAFLGDAERPERALTVDSLVSWQSACKPVGAVAIAQLWEAGHLDLDAPVADLIPDFAAGGKAAITMRHILTHTGGFRSVPFDDAKISWGECIARICATPLEQGWSVGENAGYHARSSWYILGETVRRISGRAYADYVRDEIFLPLGLSDSWIGMTSSAHEAYGDRMAVTYQTAKGAQEPYAYHTRASAMLCRPGGNGMGPIRELGRFYECLQRGGERAGTRLVKEATVREFTRPHRIGSFDETFKHRMDWGLGFIINSNRYGIQTVPYGYGKHCGESTFGHGGYQSTSGFADPDHGLVVAVAFNGTPGEPKHGKRIRDFASAVYEDLGLAA
jgi:CubicO group peptidase (beta-lactamase class C family)